MRMPRHLAAAIAVFALSAHARADESLPRDPGNVYGQFDNGLHYIIRHNANPPGRVQLYLHVKTGALNESDAQNGLAHFLEHMAFNGSTHFPPGKLLPLLGGLGMTFGADTNAHTNLWETVFKLNLPDTQPRHIDLACKIFGDYAGGLSLSDEQINNERKIILEEYRTRQGAAQRIQKETFRDMFAGTRLATHDIIGDTRLIKTFPSAEFRAYYDRWYRPENMTLIVVGDVTADDVLPSAKKWLAGVKDRTPATQPHQAGVRPTTQPRAFVYTDPEQVNANVDFTAIEPGEPPITTYDEYRRQVLRGIATEIVDRRLSNLISSGNAPFRSAGVDISPFLNEVLTASAEASGDPQEWKPMLSGVITEVNRALQHGFSDDEVKLIERGLLADAQQSVTAESTRDSTSVITGIAEAVGLDQPLLSASQQLDLLRRSIDGVNAGQFLQVFNDAFATRNYDYTVSLPAGKADLTIPSSQDVLATADAAWATKTSPPATQASNATLLAVEPAPGAVVSQDTDPDLQVTTTTFANGVVMHHKFSDYKKDDVLIDVILPGGQIEETADNRGVSELASVMLARPATSRLTSTEIRDLLTGKNVTVGGAIGLDTMGLSVKGSNKDLPAGLQLMYALLTDAKMEPSAVTDWKKNELQMIAKLQRDPRGQLRKAIDATLLGGDPRFAPLTVDDVNKLKGEQAEAWYMRIANNAAIEVTVVGDISLPDATKLIAQYVGSLPKRQLGFDALDGLRTIKRGPGPYEASVTFDSVTPQAVAMAGFVDCDDTNLDRRPLSVAAAVLTNRMIDRIRKKDQLVYSIQASSAPAHGLPGTGLFMAASVTDPANGAKVADEVLTMMAEFGKTGPTDDELATAERQVTTSITTAMREPEWWLTQLSELNYRHRLLGEFKNLPGIFGTYTKEQLQDVFNKYMQPDRMIRYVVTPESNKATTQP